MEVGTFYVLGAPNHLPQCRNVPNALEDFPASQNSFRAKQISSSQPSRNEARIEEYEMPSDVAKKIIRHIDIGQLEPGSYGE